MRRIFLPVLFSLIIIVITSHSFAREIKPFQVNYGIGIPYGGIPGINLEVKPVKYIGISAGAGYNSPAGFGWGTGAKIYYPLKDGKFRSYLSLHRGVVATINKLDDIEYNHGIGNSYGIGFQFSASEGIIDLGIHFKVLNSSSRLTTITWRSFFM